MKRIASSIAGGLVVCAAHAGVHIETVSHDLRTNTTEPQQTTYIDGTSGRFVDPEGRSTIIKDGTMIFMDDKEKTYIPFDKATMEKLASTISAQMEKHKAQLAKLPPEQRAMLEQQFGLGPEGETRHEVEAIDTGKSDKVDARACKVWDIKRNGELDEQWCVVPLSSLPGAGNLKAVFENFAKTFEEMVKNVPMLRGIMDNEFSALSKINGYPVRTRSYENGRLGEDEKLLKVWREEPIPAATFEVPAGYSKKSMPGAP